LDIEFIKKFQIQVENIPYPHTTVNYFGLIAPVLPTLRFPVNLGLFFCGVVGFSEDLRVAYFWACFLQISVFQIACFSNFMALLLFQLTTKGTLGMFL